MDMRMNGKSITDRSGKVWGISKKRQRWIREAPKNQSIGVSLIVTHNIGDMEPEEATSCSQAGFQMEQSGQQPTYKTFNPKLTLSTRNAETKDGAETVGMANH